MTFKLFLTIILFLLFVFQALQVYYFKRKQNVHGSVFIFFVWTTFVFLLYNLTILFSTNFTQRGDNQTKTVVINRGDSLSKIAIQLYSDKIISNRDHFLWTAKLLGLGHKVQAGKYSLSPFMSNYALISQLSSGHSIQERVTIVEGTTAKEIALLLSDKLDIDVGRFLSIVNDSSIVKEFGFDATTLEGYLFPETYQFNWGVSEPEVVQTLVGEFKRQINEKNISATAEHGLTPHEMVILASIIEGEAIVDDERPLISAVFHNRLKKKWRLEADPTIQYIIPDGPRRLLDKDLAIDSPYNTYRYRGLPPGPINNPGLKSLEAAGNPADEAYVYFVATGEGRHTFSSTLDEHLQAKKKLDRLRRELRRESSRQ